MQHLTFIYFLPFFVSNILVSSLSGLPSYIIFHEKSVKMHLWEVFSLKTNLSSKAIYKAGIIFSLPSLQSLLTPSNFLICSLEFGGSRY